MESEDIREQLHKYIDLAEDKKIYAIYTILEGELSSYSYDQEDIEIIHARRETYLKGATRVYSPAESLDLIGNINKQHGL